MVQMFEKPLKRRKRKLCLQVGYEQFAFATQFVHNPSSLTANQNWCSDFYDSGFLNLFAQTLIYFRRHRGAC